MPRSDGRIDQGEKAATAITAKAWNRMMDAAEQVNGRNMSVAGPGGGVPAASAFCRVMAKNNSSTTIPWMGAAKITGITPSAGAAANAGANAQFYRSPTVTVEIPSAASTTDACVVALEPIKPGKLGWVAVAGVVQCKATISDNAHTRLSLAASTTELASGFAGQLQIIWKEGAGSGKLALAILAPSGDTLKLGKTSAAWAKGASASIAIYAGTAGSETATGETVTAFNKFAAIATGKFVAIASMVGNWYVIAAECS